MMLFVGRLEPLKAVDTIVNAASLLQNADPAVLSGVRFTIVGGDAHNPERRKLAALAESLGVAHLIDFAGSKDHTQLPYYYSAAEALLMPSDYESFGMAALEAMASGTPVIASGVGGLQYLIRDGETGYLVPVRDAEALAMRLCQLLSNPHERARMGANATAVAQDYDWKIIAGKLINVFIEAQRARKSQKPAANI
jgi:D-inositol-3-phosphate glycosyltransferase